MSKLRRREKNGPGLLFIVITLIVVAIAGARFFDISPEQIEPPAAPRAEDTHPSPQPKDDPPRILILHSYATGNYQPSTDSHQRGGEPGAVVAVGHELAAVLQQAGINVIHDKTVHDKPNYSEAFLKSQKTIEAVLKEHSTIQIILDISRDGLQDKPENYTTVRIAGKEVAKVLFVIGDQNNLQTEANLAFAQQLSAELDAKYPGMSRGVRILQADFNGNLHPNSVRIVIGDWKGNTVEQAKESARLLAQVLRSMFK